MPVLGVGSSPRRTSSRPVDSGGVGTARGARSPAEREPGRPPPLPAQVIGRASNFSQREANMCFCWSRMLVVDEVKHVTINICIDFTDFIEALGRVADIISPVDVETMQEVQPF